MKKLFTLVCGLALTCGVSAQTNEQLGLLLDQYPWRYSVSNTVKAPVGDLDITFDKSWGEYGIIGASNAINPADYKGVKVEYVADASTATTETDGENVVTKYIQLSIGQTDGKGMFPKFDPSQNTLEAEFNDDIKSYTSLTKLNVQAENAGAKIVIKNFYLVKNDGTLERVDSYAAGGWGYSTSLPNVLLSTDMTISGQYAGMQIVNLDGSSLTFNNDGATEELQAYTIELEEETPNKTVVEFDGADGSFNWIHFDAGLKTLNFKVDRTTCVKYNDDETTTNKNLTKLYLKEDTNVAGEKNATTDWPVFTLKIKKITRTLGTLTGIASIETEKADANAPIYNLAGQKVNKEYKGVVIQNGKKFLRK